MIFWNLHCINILAREPAREPITSRVEPLLPARLGRVWEGGPVARLRSWAASSLVCHDGPFRGLAENSKKGWLLAGSQETRLRAAHAGEIWRRAGWLAGSRAGSCGNGENFARAGRCTPVNPLAAIYGDGAPSFSPPLVARSSSTPSPLVRDRRRAAVRRGCVQLRLVPGLRGVGHLLCRFVSGRSASYTSSLLRLHYYDLDPKVKSTPNRCIFWFMLHELGFGTVCCSCYTCCDFDFHVVCFGFILKWLMMLSFTFTWRYHIDDAAMFFFLTDSFCRHAEAKQGMIRLILVSLLYACRWIPL
jgi:hypothetical protein